MTFNWLSRGKDANGLDNLGARFRIGQFLFSETSEALSHSTPGRRVHVFMPEVTFQNAIRRTASDNGRINFPDSVPANAARDIGVEVFDWAEFPAASGGPWELTYAAALGADVTMLTVSGQQKNYLEQVIANGNSENMRVILEDIYKFHPDQQFDAIVLLGVMEHLPHYQRLLRHFDQILKPDGRVYMDFSAIRKKFQISTFTYRYVFEGNGTPVYLPELITAANNGPYEVVAVHNDRHSYFLTLKAWAGKLEANRDKLVAEFGEQTYRLFQLYIWSTAFALGHDGNLQSYRVVLQKCKDRPSETIGL